MSTENRKTVLLSGVQPSGNLTIGNYIGAIRNWVTNLDVFDCLFVLVDLHAITIRQNPNLLLKRCYEFLALYLACGIDPHRSTIFVQSHVPYHGHLGWILNCFTYMGELGRMTQFKAKQESGSATAGLFSYPVLMAADILLYDTHLVPVGADQKQHLELTRDVAIRFNNEYGNVFVVPEAYVPEIGARIMSLQEPMKKMSKSDELASNYIAILDSPDIVAAKIKQAVTDSGSGITYSPDTKPGIANLIAIYATLTGNSLSQVEDVFCGQGYGAFKKAVADTVIDFLKPIQERFRLIVAERDSLSAILDEGAARACELAEAKVRCVNETLGFIPRSYKSSGAFHNSGASSVSGAQHGI